MLRTPFGLGEITMLLFGLAIVSAQPQTGSRQLPPVDKDVPAKLETATFALG